MSNKIKRRNKKRDLMKAAISTMTGFVASWDVVDPLAENPDQSNSRFEHKNPVYRLMADEIRRGVRDTMNKVEMLWKLSGECEFKDAQGKPYFRSFEMVIRGILGRAEPEFVEVMEELFAESNMNQYVITHMRAEVLGDRKKRESDFKVAA